MKEVMFSCSGVIWPGPVPLIEEEQDQQKNKEGKKQTELPKEMLSCIFVKSMCGSTADVTNYVLYLENSGDSWEVPLMTVDLSYPCH